MTKKVIDATCLCQGSIKDVIGALNEEIDASVEVAPINEEIIEDVVQLNNDLGMIRLPEVVVVPPTITGAFRLFIVDPVQL